MYKEKNKHYHKGVHIFNLDLYTKKILQFNSTKKQNSIFKGIEKKDAIPLKSLLNQFEDNQTIKRKFREAMVDISSGKPSHKITFEGKLKSSKKKSVYLVDITFHENESSSDYLMLLS